jgi:AcrR family transcriptional regulator
VPRIVDHALQREQILERCLPLFAAKGYAAVSMRELARTLGVSTGTLYHYFAGKDDIFEQMLVALAQRDVLRALSDLPDQASGSLRLAALLRFVEDNAEHLQQLVAVAWDWLRHAPSPERREVVTRVASLYEQALGDKLGGGDPALGGLVFRFVLGELTHRTLAGSTGDPAVATRLQESLRPA